MLALKNEHRSAIITLFLLNILLALFNLIEIPGQFVDRAADEKHYLSVHRGVYSLLAGIALSIGVILYYFRGRQNYFPKNKLLKILAYIWIAQNFVLLLSAGLRDYWYIFFDGLTHKRLGVLFYLLLNLVGLISLVFKIKNRLSIFYLLRINSWFALITLVLISPVNWDARIANYNLNHWQKYEIDHRYLLQLSDKALIELSAGKRNVVIGSEEYNQNLNSRINRFLFEEADQDLRSWNLADSRAYKKLIAEHLKDPQW